jgi:hypothetical protein
MSVVKPAASKASFSAGRSPFSQRGEDAESGKITQARPLAAAAAVSSLAAVSLPLEHAANKRAAAAVTATTPKERFNTQFSFVLLDHDLKQIKFLTLFISNQVCGQSLADRVSR